MKIEDLATLMGKTKEEIQEILDNNGVIELKLTERNIRKKEGGKLELIN